MFDASYLPPVVGGKKKQAHILSRELISKNICVQAISYIHSGNADKNYEGVPIDSVRKSPFSLPLLLLKLIYHRFKFRILHIHIPSRIGKLMAVVVKTL
jgi:hypothetical protein